MALWQKPGVFRVKLFTIRDKPHVKQILQTPLLDSKSMWPLRTTIQRHCICTTFFRHIFYSYQSNDKKVFLFRKHHMQGLMSQKMNCIAPVCFCLVAMCTCLHSLTKFHSWKPYQVQKSPFIEIYSIWFYQKQCIFMAKVSAASAVHSCAFKNCLKNLTFRSFFMVLHRSCSDFDSAVFPSHTSQWRQKKWKRLSLTKFTHLETPKHLLFGLPGCRVNQFVFPHDRLASQRYWRFWQSVLTFPTFIGQWFSIPNPMFLWLLHAQRHHNLCF